MFRHFWESFILFSMVAVPIYIPTSGTQGSLFSTFMPPFATFVFLMMAVLTGVVVLMCISLMTRDVEHLLMYLFAICMSSLEKMSIQVLCPFLSWVVCFLLFFVIELCEFFNIFWILAPYQIYSWQILFSHSVGCLLTLLIVSFVVQKLFSLM